MNNHLSSYTKYQFLKESNFKINIVFILFGSLVAAAIQYYLWTSIDNNTSVYTDNYMVYAMIAILINLLLPMNQVARLISSKIIKGDIVIWMLRPNHLIETAFFLIIGKSLFTAIFQCIPLILCFIFIFRIEINLSLITTIQFLGAFSLGYIISFLIGFIISLISVYFVSINGFIAFLNGCMVIFGGAIIPISIYPEWLQNVAILTPFYYVLFYPLSLLTLNEVTWVPIIIQLFWIIILFLIILFTTKKVFEKANISGG